MRPRVKQFTPYLIQSGLTMTRLFTSVILKILYDIDLDDEDNLQYMHVVEETMRIFAEAGVVGAFLVDTIPLCTCSFNTAYNIEELNLFCLQ